MAGYDTTIVEYEVYEFNYNGIKYRYTSHFENVTYNNNIYIAVPMKRGEIVRSIDLAPQKLTISMNIIPSFVEDLTMFPINTITVTMSHVVRDSIVFKGQVIDILRNNQQIALSVDIGCYELNTVVPRVKIQSLCNNILFNTACGLNADDYVLQAKISSINNSRNELVLINWIKDKQGKDFTDQNDSYFKMGQIQFSSGYKMLVVESNKNDGKIWLHYKCPVSIIVGEIVLLWPGCDKTFSTCDVKYSNKTNFLGMPYIPTIDPVKWGIRVS